MSAAAKPALVVVDVQCGFDNPRWGARNNPDAEKNVARLLAAWRAAGAPIFHFRHDSVLPESPLRPGQPGNAIHPEATPRPGEPVFGKNVNSCFIGTPLESELRKRGITRVVVVGITTDHCVSTTVRMAANLGFQVWVAADATATFERVGPSGRRFSAEEMHQAELASLHGEFATVATVADITRLLSA